MPGPTAEQDREIKRGQRLGTYLSEKQTIVNSYIPMKLEVIEFQTNLTLLLEAATGKNTESKYITKDKKDLKEDIARDTEYVSSLAHVFALKYNHSALAAATNLSYDRILKTRDESIASLTSGVIDAVTPFLTDADFGPYDIKTDDLDKIGNETTAFVALIGKADEEESHNTVDNSEIDDALEVVRGNIRRMEKLVVKWKVSDPGFVQGFHLNAAIDDSGIRHNGVEGTLTDEEGSPVFKAKVTLRGTKYAAESTLSGDYRIIEARAGDYILEIEAEGFVKIEKLIHISPRKVIDMDFVMRRVP